MDVYNADSQTIQRSERRGPEGLLASRTGVVNKPNREGELPYTDGRVPWCLDWRLTEKRAECESGRSAVKAV
jgi:hypothetical protein